MRKYLIIIVPFAVLSVLVVAGCNDFLTEDVVIGGGDTARDDDGGDGGGGGGDAQPDDDDDGLSNDVEEAFNMDPRQADTDQDGFADGLEFVDDEADPLDGDISPGGLNRARILNVTEAVTDIIDTDLDGLGNLFEQDKSLEPEDPDTDDDGYRDSLELIENSDPFVATSRPSRTTPPTSDGIVRTGSGPLDSDRDGLADDIESINGTLTNKADSDDDGFGDGIEFVMGSNGADRLSIPNFSVPPPPAGTTDETDDSSSSSSSSSGDEIT